MSNYKLFYEGKVSQLYADSTDPEAPYVKVYTDNISALDSRLGSKIPKLGIIRNLMTVFFKEMIFDSYIINNDVISLELDKMPEQFQSPEYEGRVCLIANLEPDKFEHIARRYATGSLMSAYSRGERWKCGHKLPEGLVEGSDMGYFMYGPSTKAPVGEHDEDVTLESVMKEFGDDEGLLRRKFTLDIANRLYEFFLDKGFIMADIKVEFAQDTDGTILLSDEISPDTFRVWKKDDYVVGQKNESYDKEIVRTYVKNFKEENPDYSGKIVLPEDIIQKTFERYKDLYEIVSGFKFNY